MPAFPAPVKMVRKVTAFALLFALVGVGLAWSAFAIEQVRLTPLTESYFGDNSKEERDAAPAGSALALQLAEIESLKPTLLTMKLTGIATVLFGVTLALAGILRMLSLMPIGLSETLRATFIDMGVDERLRAPAPARGGAPVSAAPTDR